MNAHIYHVILNDFSVKVKLVNYSGKKRKKKKKERGERERERSKRALQTQKPTIEMHE